MSVNQKDILSDAEKALRETDARLLDTQSRLEAALSAGGIATWTWDLVTDLLVVDEYFARLFSVTPEYAAGGLSAAYFQAIHPEDRPRVVQAIAEAVDGRDIYEAEYRVVLPDGSHRWLSARGLVERDAEGRAIALPGALRDITERVDRERRERFLSELADRSRGMTDPNEVIVDAVRSIGEFFGAYRCVFADIDIEADTCKPFPNYRADDSVVELNVAFSLAQFGSFILSEFQNGRAVVVDDIRNDATGVPLENLEAYEAIGIRAHISVPVMHSSRLVAAIAVHSDTPRRWEPEDAPMIRTVVERTWLTVEVLRQQRIVKHQAEERLASLERTNTILESITDAFIALDTGWRLTYINDQAERLVFQNRDEVMGRVLWDVFPELVGSTFEHQYRRAADERVFVTFEEFFPPLDAWFEVRAYPSEGGLSLFFQNVNERRRTQDAIRASEESLKQSEAQLRDAQVRLESALAAGRIATWTYDLVMDRVVADTNLAQLFSVSPEDAVGGSLAAYLQAIHPEDRPRVSETIETAIASGDVYQSEYRVVLPDGSHRWLATRGRIERDETGRAVALPGVVLDVTERVERERRELFLADLAERSRGMIDPDDIIADAVRSIGEFFEVARCVFADIDLGTDACTIPRDYCANDAVASMVGTFPISAFGPYLVGEYAAGRTVVADDVRNDSARFSPEHVVSYDAVACRAFIAVPVLHSARLVSVVAIHNSTVRHWAPEEVQLLQLVVGRTWLTVEVLRQQDALARETKERLAAHERTAAILDSITDASYAVDSEYRFTHINRQAEAVWGCAREEFLGQCVLDVLPQAASSFSFEQHKRVMAERKPLHYETISSIIDRWVQVSIYPTLDGGLSVFFRDISERKEMEAERMRLAERERNIASQLQAALQPPLPGNIPGLRIGKYYEAALAEEATVGGDFYDVFGVEKGCTAIVVGDLSGKGLHAAAQVSTVRNMLRAFLYSTSTVTDAVTELNRVVAQNNLLSGFSTLFVGTFDSALKTLTYVNCGQEPGLVRRGATGVVEQLRPTGPILGTIENAHYVSQTTQLSSGDALALFSDGLTEVGPSRKEMLGIEGVAGLLGRPVPEETARDAGEMVDHLVLRLIEGVNSAAKDGVVRDDVCLLIAAVE